MFRSLLGASVLAVAAAMPLGHADERKDGKDYSGFPPIGKHRPGAKSFKTITSDAVTGLLRPKWTRAMTDLGGWPVMYRFKKNIYIAYPHVDGHQEKRLEATGKQILLVSKDDGRSWKEIPSPDMHGPPEVVVANDKVYWFDFDDKKFTRVRVSEDGETFGEPKQVYKAPFWLWGVTYDPGTKAFWAPAHAIRRENRQIDLVTSKDGLEWEYVSTIAKHENASESTLRFEKDGTMVVLMRQKFSKTEHTLCTAKAPYKEWVLKVQKPIVEGEHFFEIDGQTFMASRAIYTGDNKEVKSNPNLLSWLNDRCYAVVYRFTPERTLVPWAVMDSDGDCSYPHLVETPDEILCCYYSQHNDKVCKVYLCGFDKKAFLKVMGKE